MKKGSKTLVFLLIPILLLLVFTGCEEAGLTDTEIARNALYEKIKETLDDDVATMTYSGKTITIDFESGITKDAILTVGNTLVAALQNYVDPGQNNILTIGSETFTLTKANGIEGGKTAEDVGKALKENLTPSGKITINPVEVEVLVSSDFTLSFYKDGKNITFTGTIQLKAFDSTD
ncbi:MAG: hypothetical protein ACOXZ4_05770 [Sphaerochaetaceae bacterium]